MTKKELFEQMIPIILSVITTIATTQIINYFKEIKNKKLQSMVPFDRRNELINFIIFDSFYCFVSIIMIKSSIGTFKPVFIILYGLIYIGLIIIKYDMYKDALEEVFKNFKANIVDNLIIMAIFIIWLFSVYFIIKIDPLGDKYTWMFINSTLSMYITLSLLKLFINLEIKRMYKVILISTKDDIKYKTQNIDFFDQYIAIYEKDNNRRIILFNSEIKTIEYLYDH